MRMSSAPLADHFFLVLGLVVFILQSGTCSLSGNEASSHTEDFLYTENVVPGDPGWDVGPTVFQNRDGKLTMIWTGGPPTSSEASSVSLWKSTSTDDGLTWSKAEIFLREEKHGIFNPVSIVLPDDEVLLFHNPTLLHIREVSCMMRSADGGKTWSKPQKIETGYAYGSFRSPPILLKSGKILVPYYHENSISRGKGPEPWAGSCLISPDGGKTWKKGGDMYGGNTRGAQEPAIVELTDRRLYALIRTNEGVQYESYSSDEGTTWTKPAPSRFHSPDASAIIRRLASGRIILLWDNVATKDDMPRSPLDIASSLDNGKTWRVKRIKSAHYQLSNFSVLQLRSGYILVAIGSANPISIARFSEKWIDK